MSDVWQRLEAIGAALVEVETDHFWPARLVRNLAIGAALCRADVLGLGRGIRIGTMSGQDAWRPGCRRPAP